MEFNEKLQNLRKSKNLTQEELSTALFVSRTAVSKWESGRGFPNLDTLKAIAKYFEITIDQLLSGEELITIAKENTAKKESRFRDIIYGLFDCSAAVLFFLPLFRQETNGIVQSVSLISISQIEPYLKIIFFIAIITSVLLGILTLALQNCETKIWVKTKRTASLILNAFCALLFIVSMQPYAAVFVFLFLIIKLLMR